MEDLPDLAKASRDWQAVVDARVSLWLQKNRPLAERAQHLANQDDSLASAASTQVCLLLKGLFLA
jgi:hypothetical protein